MRLNEKTKTLELDPSEEVLELRKRSGAYHVEDLPT